MKALLRKITKKLPSTGKNKTEKKQNTPTTKPKDAIVTLDIEGIMPGRYNISPLGRVIDNETNKIVEIDYRNRIGRVLLCTDKGTYKEFSLNRLLATVFIPKTEKDILYERNIVHVKDWDKTNHNVNNLQWCNQSEIYIYVSYYKQDRKDRDNEKLYIEMLIKRNYDFDDILEIIPFTTPMHDIVAIYRDMKI